MDNFKSMKYMMVLVWFVLFNESGALKDIQNHEVSGFHCINGNYIRSSWFCDGVNDCGDASDESYGCDQEKCGGGNFTCKNSQCLNISVRCNRISDCADNSDENFCDHEPPLDNCDLKHKKFLCKDKLRCVSLTQVCDEEVHCFDGSDEMGNCDEYDPDICNVCFGGCYRTPNGPKCLYNTSTYSSDYKNCLANENFCDQKCVSLYGTNQCSCEENFVPEYTILQHSFYCEEKDKEKNMFLYTIKGAIRGIPGYSNRSIVVKETKENITAIAAANDFVYWGGTHNRSKVIGKKSFSENETKFIVTQGIEDVTAMDVDWRTGNVYFIDNIRKRIAACTNDGKRCIQVRKLNQESTSITLTPRLGRMYWAIRDDKLGDFIIKRSNMNGKSSYDFVNEGLRHVSCLSADEASGKLYWVDTVLRRIEVIRFDETGRKVFMSDLGKEYISIAVNARYLYWIVKNNSNIYFTPGTRARPTVALKSTDPVHLMYGYSHSEKSTKMEAPCSWGCKGICLMYSRVSNKTGSNCFCANATKVEDNGIWCLEDAQFSTSHDYNQYEGVTYVISRDIPNHSFRMILVIVLFIVILSGTIFYLYRKGLCNNLSLFRHARM